ncbi:MAG TPA: hypothetical protein VGE01_10630 [Fimbriimonas sp.]
MRITVTVEKIDGGDQYTFDTDHGDVVEFSTENEMADVQGADGVIRRQPTGRFLLSLRAAGVASTAAPTTGAVGATEVVTQKRVEYL